MVLEDLDHVEGVFHMHPDERFLTMVGTAIDWPASLSEYFDTASSPLSPANRGHEFFVYGTLAPGRPNEHVLEPLDGTWRGRRCAATCWTSAGVPSTATPPSR